MAHYAWLTGCPSRDSAARYDLSEFTAESGPELEARYMIPLLWLACFEPGDAVTVTIASSPTEEPKLLVLCSPITDVIQRLRRRQSSVLAFIGPSFAPLYGDWIGFLERHYVHTVLLRTEDLFAMEGYEKSGLRLQAALRFMAVADTGARIKERAAIDFLTSLDATTFAQRVNGEGAESAAMRWRAILSGVSDSSSESITWPLPPADTEVAFAASRPEAALPPPAGTAAAADDDLTRKVRHGVFADPGTEGLRLALDKIAGNVPLGVNAPTKGLRKLIGGGGELLEFLVSGVLGLMLLLFGIVFLWVGVGASPDWGVLGVGAVLVVIAVVALRSARAALHKLRAIARA